MEEDLTPEKKKKKKGQRFQIWTPFTAKIPVSFHMSSLNLAKFISFSHTFVLYKCVVAFESRTMFRFQPV